MMAKYLGAGFLYFLLALGALTLLYGSGRALLWLGVLLPLWAGPALGGLLLGALVMLLFGALLATRARGR